MLYRHRQQTHKAVQMIGKEYEDDHRDELKDKLFYCREVEERVKGHWSQLHPILPFPFTGSVVGVLSLRVYVGVPVFRLPCSCVCVCV